LNIEWLILADSAQIVNNKLYLLGGGWERLTLKNIPTSHSCSVAMSFIVPWADTNQKHGFRINIVDEDGQDIRQPITGQVEAGRAAGIPAGTDQRVQLSLDLQLRLEKPGTYVVHASLAERDTASVKFRVQHAP
jgi:hypothetical protein